MLNWAFSLCPFVFSQLEYFCLWPRWTGKQNCTFQCWRGEETFQSSVCDNLVDWNNRSEIKVCTQQFRTKLLLFYTAHQLYCQSDMATNRHECALESSSCKKCFQQFAHCLEIQIAQVTSPLCSPFSPTLIFNKFAFHKWETTVSKCQIWEEDLLLPCQLYTPFLSIFQNRDYIGLRKLCALLPPLVFCYSNLIQNRQNTPLEAGSYLESP